MFYPFLYIAVTHNLSCVGWMPGLLSTTTVVVFCPKYIMVKHFMVPSEGRADLQLKHQHLCVKIIVFFKLHFMQFFSKNMSSISCVQFFIHRTFNAKRCVDRKQLKYSDIVEGNSKFLYLTPESICNAKNGCAIW